MGPTVAAGELKYGLLKTMAWEFGYADDAESDGSTVFVSKGSHYHCCR